jgi:ABC-type glycerol-3-phosphate transport system substrate-binding protein
MKKMRIALAVLIAALTLGAVTPNSFVTPQTPNNGKVQFTSSSTAGTYVTLYTAGANGSRCNAIWETNDDSATHLIDVRIAVSSTNYGGVALTSTADNQSTSGAAPDNLLGVWSGLPRDQYGNPYLQIISGDTLSVTFATSITGGDVVNVVAQCSDY